MGRLYIRHTEKAYSNGKNSIFAHDPEITHQGVAEAKKLAIILRDKFGEPEIIFYSPYRRTRETAYAMSSIFPVKPKMLCDVSLSEFLGHQKGKNIELTPETSSYSPPPPESMRDFEKRIRSHLKDTEQYDNLMRKVWFITHGIVISFITKIICEKQIKKIRNLECLEITRYQNSRRITGKILDLMPENSEYSSGSTSEFASEYRSFTDESTESIQKISRDTNTSQNNLEEHEKSKNNAKNLSSSITRETASRSTNESALPETSWSAEKLLLTPNNEILKPIVTNKKIPTKDSPANLKLLNGATDLSSNGSLLEKKNENGERLTALRSYIPHHVPQINKQNNKIRDAKEVDDLVDELDEFGSDEDFPSDQKASFKIIYNDSSISTTQLKAKSPTESRWNRVNKNSNNINFNTPN